ncbi:MAG: hypothetical protein D6772_02750 [Bacteroidetes bacterium]|nr:MAG: hypothetical protein D6772_02750 [Bacteroidota bacterium]
MWLSLVLYMVKSSTLVMNGCQFVVCNYLGSSMLSEEELFQQLLLQNFSWRLCCTISVSIAALREIKVCKNSR